MSVQGGRGGGRMHYAGGRRGKAAGGRRGKAADKLQAADGLAERRQGRGKASGGHKISFHKLVTIWISLLKEQLDLALAQLQNLDVTLNVSVNSSTHETYKHANTKQITPNVTQTGVLMGHYQ